MCPPPLNFALIGAAGYVAPKHMAAIRDTGHQLVAALDPHDNVGVLDRYFPDARFFTEYERFDRHLEKCRRAGPSERVHFVSICSPNYLHDAHIRAALRLGADAICEKPLVINPWNMDAIAELEKESGRRVFTVLQLRCLPALQALRSEARTSQSNTSTRAQVVLTYITRRGHWYNVSWKGDPSKSGGLAMNIGVHLFDLMLWMFGSVEESEVHLAEPARMAGFMRLAHADVRWFLSTDARDLPEEVRQRNGHAFRSITTDGREIEFSENFTDLHTRVYQEIFAGRGVGIEEARPSILALAGIRAAVPCPVPEHAHPLLVPCP